MSIVVKINGVDRSQQVKFDSLKVKNRLYSNSDFCFFTYKKYGARTYTPAGGDEVGVWDGATKIFGGKMVGVTKRVEGTLLVYDINCKDWVDTLDGFLVGETYVSQTVNQIIADIQATYATAFNIDNVDCTTNIERILFESKPVSKCIDDLAEIAGFFWYVDPDKKIYFFEEGDYSSPYDLTDTNDKYIFGSLALEDDYEQIKNKVNIKGGSIANVQVEDATSIAAYGQHEVLIKDDTLTSTAQATQKADSVLAAYKDPVQKGEFKTLVAGLVSGQQINIQSDIRSLNQNFIIEAVTFECRTPTDFDYQVSVMTQRSKTLIEFFEKEILQPLPIPSFGNEQWSCDVEFSITDFETISWSAGTLRMASGETYSIGADSQVVSGAEVIYFLPTTSITALQFSTTFADGMGEDRIALAYAVENDNSALGAQVIPIGFMGGMNFWSNTNIVARTIVAEQVALDSLTGNELNIQTKIAINDRTFGDKGIQLDYNSGTPRAYIGDGANKYFNFDGTNISWKAQNTELDTDGNLTMSGGSVTGGVVQTAATGSRIKLTGGGHEITFLYNDTVHSFIDQYNWAQGYGLAIDSQDFGVDIGAGTTIAYSGFYNNDVAFGTVGSFGLYIYAAGSAPFTTLNVFSDYSIIPVTDDAYDLGYSTYQWRNLHIDGTAYIDAISMGGNILPETTNIHTLGSSSFSFGNCFLGQTRTRLLYPATDATYDLGTSSIGWRSLYIDKIYTGSVQQIQLESFMTEFLTPIRLDNQNAYPASNLEVGQMYYHTGEDDVRVRRGDNSWSDLCWYDERNVASPIPTYEEGLKELKKIKAPKKVKGMLIYDTADFPESFQFTRKGGKKDKDHIDLKLVVGLLLKTNQELLEKVEALEAIV